MRRFGKMTMWRATRKTLDMWKEIYWEWRLYFECLFYYFMNYREFKRMKMHFHGVGGFLKQMEHFIIVDPYVNKIKSLHKSINKDDLQQKITQTDKAMIQELAKTLKTKTMVHKKSEE